MKKKLNDITSHTKESALAFYLDNLHSKVVYCGLAKDSKWKGFPIYQTEKEVAVSLQNMLDKTSERLFESVALSWDLRHLLNLKLRVTFGFDSSSGHNAQQEWQSANNNNNDENNKKPHQSLFVTSINIIQLHNSHVNECSWINPTPQSVRFSRSLRISLEKEDELSSVAEFNRLKKRRTISVHITLCYQMERKNVWGTRACMRCFILCSMASV